jgi:hypothetical protein
MRCVRSSALALLAGCLLLLPSLAGEYRLVNGNVLRGEIVSADEDGLVVKLDVGGFSNREPWVNVSQETLRTLALNSEYAPLVEPFIELAPEELKAREKKREIVVRDVPNRIARPEGRARLLAGFMTPIGLYILGILLAGNLYAAYEIARFRSRPTALVVGVSLVLPVLGPVLFLSLPSEQAPEPPPPTPEEAAAAAAALTVPTGGERGAGGLSLASTEKTATASAATQPQVFSRGENTFNRRFFETKFPGFFRVVLGEAERDLVLVFRTPKSEIIAKRISRISSNELHVVLLSNNSELSLNFSEITTVILKHKDAKV